MKALALRRASVPVDAVARERDAARRSTRTVVDLAADIRTLTSDAECATEQRDQAYAALAATLAAIQAGWSAPGMFAVAVLTEAGLMPAPGADPHAVLAAGPGWIVGRDAVAADLHADDRADGRLQRDAQLSPDLHAAGSARDFVAALAADWHLPEAVAYNAQTTVSELVTNAVTHVDFARHAPNPGFPGIRIVLELSPAGDELTIEVHDPDPRTPVRCPQPAVAAIEDLDDGAGLGGAGLRVVEGLALAHGSRSTRHGKICWATLAVTADGGAR